MSSLSADSVTYILHIFTYLEASKMGAEKHTILGGKVHVYRRENSRFW